MAEMLSPGIYVTETDASVGVRSQSTSTFGMVGVFERGPIGEPVLVTSMEDARTRFGYSANPFVAGHYGLLALQSFFNNGGSRAYVVRTAHYENGVLSARASSVEIQGRGVGAEDTLKVSAKDEGSWGDDLVVTVASSQLYANTGFNLIVSNAAGAVLETHADLVLDPASNDYVEKKVGAKSAYIVVEDLGVGGDVEDALPALGDHPLEGGDDGLAGISPLDFVGDEAAGSGLYALDTVDVNFVAIPGESYNTTVASGIRDYCERSKECFGILETPPGASVQDMADHSDTLGIDSSYVSLNGPWLEATHPVTGRTVSLPPAGVVAGLYARNDALGAVWTAPAGVNRAIVRGVLRAETRISKAGADVLQPKRVNPILVAPGGSLCLYGQRTMQVAQSATDRVNVRRLMIFVESSIRDAAQGVVFEANDKGTWEAFKRMVNPFLQRIKDGGGFTDFLTICDETINTPAVIDNNEMRARILVRPTRTAEIIPIEFVVAGSGVDFSEL